MCGEIESSWRAEKCHGDLSFVGWGCQLQRVCDLLTNVDCARPRPTPPVFFVLATVLRTGFNGDLSKWDVAKVQTMSSSEFLVVVC